MKRQNVVTLSGTIEIERFTAEGAWGKIETDRPWFGGVHRLFLPRPLAAEAMALHQAGMKRVEATVTGSVFSPPVGDVIEKAKRVAATRGWESAFEWLAERVPAVQGHVVAEHVVWHVSEKERRYIKAFVEKKKAG